MGLSERMKLLAMHFMRLIATYCMRTMWPETCPYLVWWGVQDVQDEFAKALAMATAEVPMDDGGINAGSA